MKLEFIVPKEKDGWCVRDFLRICGVSSTAIRAVKYTENGITKNNFKANTNHIVNTGDKITVNLHAENSTTVIPQDMTLEIVYESESVMVLNKPANIAVHPTLGYVDGTLANGFCGLMEKRGTPKPFRAINRLDKNTSGLVLLALNSVCVPVLAKSVHKEYFAILQGLLTPKNGRIDLPIKRSENSIITRMVDENGKKAITDYEVLESKNNISLVKAIPITGRTHQLRVHFSYLGYPLCGDELYGGSSELIQRHALHCGTVKFIEPFTQEFINISSKLSEDMNNLLQNSQIFWQNSTKE